MERSCGPMNKDRIEGVADQGERAMNREALVIKGERRRSGGRAVKECVLTWGDLAFARKGDGVEPEREVSRGRINRWEGGDAVLQVKGRTRGSVRGHVDVASITSDACASRAVQGRTR